MHRFSADISRRSHLRIEAFNLEIRHQKLDGFLVNLVLPQLAKFDHVVEEGRVGHARQTVGLEGRLDEVHFLLGDIKLELLYWKGL